MPKSEVELESQDVCTNACFEGGLAESGVVSARAQAHTRSLGTSLCTGDPSSVQTHESYHYAGAYKGEYSQETAHVFVGSGSLAELPSHKLKQLKHKSSAGPHRPA